MDTQKKLEMVLQQDTAMLLPSVMHSLSSIVAGNKIELKEIANSYVQDGNVWYGRLFAIPVNNRLIAMEGLFGKEAVHLMVCQLLRNFQDSFNVPAKMNDVQLIDCAYDLLLEAKEYHCAVEDFVVFFERAKKGDYGKVYNRLDNSVMLQLFDEYLNERHKELLRLRNSETLTFEQERREIDDVERANRGLHSLGAALGQAVAGMREIGYYPNSKLNDSEIKHPI